MIRSLRRRLVLTVLGAVAVLLAAFGLAVYAAARWAMTEEFEAARTSTINAHYTRLDMAAAMWETARAMGFHVHLFDDPAALRPALEACGLL